MAGTIRIEGLHDSGLKEPKSEPQRRGIIGEILNFVAKFAFDSTVHSFLKISNGVKHFHKVEEKESKEEPLRPYNDKNKEGDFKLLMEKTRQDDMNNIKQRHNISTANNLGESEALKKLGYDNLLAKMEKMQEDVYDIKHQHKVSTKRIEELESSKKKCEEDTIVYDHQNYRNRVFIRSRL